MVDTKPIVSIVMITYNNPDIACRALESAQRFAGETCEIVVVDNASTDNTSEVIAAAFPDIRLITRTVNSPVMARNEGFEAASGAYVLSLDHDMVLPDPDFLERGIQLFDAFPEAGVLSVKICGEDNPTDALDSHWWYPTPRDAQNEYFWTTYFPEGAVFFRSEVLEETGGYDEDFYYTAENLDLAARILRAGWKILYCAEPVAIELVVSDHRSLHRSHSNELSLRNRLWVAWKHYELPKAVAYAIPRIGIDAIRAVRYKWFDYYVAGLRKGLLPPPEIRSRRDPMTKQEWEAIHAVEGVRVVPPAGLT